MWSSLSKLQHAAQSKLHAVSQHARQQAQQLAKEFTELEDDYSESDDRSPKAGNQLQPLSTLTQQPQSQPQPQPVMEHSNPYPPYQPPLAVSPHHQQQPHSQASHQHQQQQQREDYSVHDLQLHQHQHYYDHSHSHGPNDSHGQDLHPSRSFSPNHTLTASPAVSPTFAHPSHTLTHAEPIEHEHEQHHDLLHGHIDNALHKHSPAASPTQSHHHSEPAYHSHTTSHSNTHNKLELIDLDTEQKELLANSDNANDSINSRSAVSVLSSAFSPASSSPTSVPHHSLNDASPHRFFDLPYTPAHSTDNHSDSDVRLLSMLDEKSIELETYKEELVTIKATMRRNDSLYQSLLNEKENEIQLLKHNFSLQAQQQPQHPSGLTLQRALTQPLQPSLTATDINVHTNSNNDSLYQSRITDLESHLSLSQQQLSDYQSVTDELRHSHDNEIRSLQSNFEEALSLLQSQVQSLTLQLAQSHAQSSHTRTDTNHDDVSASVSEELMESKISEVRNEYEREIEDLKKELFVLQSKQSQSLSIPSTPSHSHPHSRPTTPLTVGRSRSDSQAELSSQLTQLRVQYTHSQSAIASLKENNSTLLNDLALAHSIKEKMLDWKEKAESMMAQWKHEREEREARIKQLKKQIKDIEKSNSELKLNVARESEERDQLHQVEKDKLYSELRRLQQELRDRDRINADETSLLRENIQLLQQELNLLQKELNSLQQSFNDSERDKAQLVQSLADRHSNELESSENRCQLLIEELKEKETDFAELNHLYQSLLSAPPATGSTVDEDHVSQLSEEIELLHSENQAMKAQLAQSQSAYQSLTDDATTLRKRNDGYQRQIQSLQSRLNELTIEHEHELQSLQSQYQQSVSVNHVDELKHQYEAKITMIETQANARLQSLQSQYEQEQQSQSAQHDAAISSLTQQLQSLQSSLSSQSSDVDKLRQFQSMLKSARESYEALSKRYNELQSECRALMKREQESQSLIQQLQAAKTDGDDFNTEMLNENIQRLTADLDARTAELEDAKTKLKSNSLSEKEAEIAKLREQIQSLTLDANVSESLTNDFHLLQTELFAVSKERDELRSTLAQSQSAASERDAEADRLRAELANVRSELTNSRDIANKYQSTQKELAMLQSSLTTVRDQLIAAQKNTKALSEENGQLKRGLEETMKKMKAFSASNDDDETNLIDRRLVVKMLVTYFERQYSQDVLNLMARMLGFSEEEKKRINASRGVVATVGKSLLSFASMLSPFDTNATANANSGIDRDNANLADLWVDFLLKQSDDSDGTGRQSQSKYPGIASPAPTQRSTATVFSTPQPSSVSNPNSGMNGNYPHSVSFTPQPQSHSQPPRAMSAAPAPLRAPVPLPPSARPILPAPGQPLMAMHPMLARPISMPPQTHSPQPSIAFQSAMTPAHVPRGVSPVPMTAALTAPSSSSPTLPQ